MIHNSKGFKILKLRIRKHGICVHMTSDMTTLFWIAKCAIILNIILLFYIYNSETMEFHKIFTK